MTLVQVVFDCNALLQALAHLRILDPVAFLRELGETP